MSTTEHATDYRKYLDPKTLARISSLDLRARLIVEGQRRGVDGQHRAVQHGISILRVSLHDTVLAARDQFAHHR